MTRALVAGIGNVFFRDDAFGSEAVRRLAQEPLPPQVRVVDFGIRGIHAAFEMIEGYDAVVFVDAVRRGQPPGTLYVIEPDELPASVPDAHAMELHNVLAFYERLALGCRPAIRPNVAIVGCEPENTSEGIGMSDALVGALPASIHVIRSVLERNGIGVQTV